MEELDIKIPESGDNTVLMSEEERKEILNTIVSDIVLEYKKMLDKLPNGAVYIRKMNNSSFVYRRRSYNRRARLYS